MISIVGPTGIGKTALALELASSLGSEIISADSRQLFRELNIGTAKPTDEELDLVKHHLINSHSIHDDFDAGQFSEMVDLLLHELFEKSQISILVGGSGLYLSAVWDGFDPIPKSKDLRNELMIQLEEDGLEPLLAELESRDPVYFLEVDRSNPQRVIRALEVIRLAGKPYSDFRRKSKKTDKAYSDLKIGLEMPREQLYQVLDLRMDQMISNGLFDEAKDLFKYRNLNALQTVGYTEIFGFLENEYDYDEAVRLLKRNSRRYAKRQLTWFRKYSDISWFHPKDITGIKSFIRSKVG